jgi:hypothetical protein
MITQAELRDKLAQPEQGPITWLKTIGTLGGFGKFVEAKPNEKGAKPVYLTPPQRTWVGLTLNEIALIHANYPNPQGFALALQAKLKEKNT